jgi:hypothetical protein
MPEEADDLFPLLERTDRVVIEQVVQSVRACLRRDDLTPEQIHCLAVLLFGLGRLPRATPGLHASLRLYQTGGDSYVSVNLSADSFHLYSGTSVSDGSGASNTYTENACLVEVGGLRDVQSSALSRWMDDFRCRMAGPACHIVAFSGACAIDWQAKADESAWRRAAQWHEVLDHGRDEWK